MPSALDLDDFKKIDLQVHVNADEAPTTYPDRLNQVLAGSDVDQAVAAVTSWHGYEISPLISLPLLATQLNIENISYKDEGARFGLGSFKALGGAYAVQRLIQEKLSVEFGREIKPEELTHARFKKAISNHTIVTATDGNHGRSVAWGAQQIGCPCRIYMHAKVSEARQLAVEAHGAEVIRVAGNYDESVRKAAQDAAKNEWFVVSDTSYHGYMDVPRNVMAGYTVMSSEILAQQKNSPPFTHVFIQGGVGGLAAAVCAHLWQALGVNRPIFVIVEPEYADCLRQSAANQAPTVVKIEQESLMAGLSCGEISSLAWSVLSEGAEGYMTIPESLVAPTMRLLANDFGIVAGESAIAGLAGLIAACDDEAIRQHLKLKPNSRVLLFGTEGATDPEIYQQLVGRSAESIKDPLA